MAEQYSEHDLKRARVGGALILVFAAAAIGIFFIDAIVRATTEGPRITVVTQTAPGVEPGTAVWVAGRDAGRVLSVEFTEPTRGAERVQIVAVIGRGVEQFIRADATVSIQPGAVLQPVVLVIDPGSGDAPPWDLETPFVTDNRRLDPQTLLEMGTRLQASGDSLRVEAGRVERAITRGDGTLRAFAENPDRFSTTGETVRNAMDVLATSSEGSLGLLAADTVIRARLERIRQRLAVLDTLDLKERATASLDETSAALDAFEGRLIALSARLDAGEGTAGRWLHDGEIERQLALLRSRLDSATVEFAKYPDRWLRVKVF